MEQDWRVFTIRRLFKEDMADIQQYGRYFSGLYFNPFCEEYIWQIMLEGAFWAVCHKENIVAITYVLPADSTAFTKLSASWHIVDLLDCSLENTLICGYLWVKDEYTETDFYSALTKLWLQQAERRGRQMMIHYMPAGMVFDMENLVYSGFDLVGLRGLDNLVPHYIFVKYASFERRNTNEYRDIKTVSSTDTKAISMLCEKGYKGFDITVEKNILFGR